MEELKLIVAGVAIFGGVIDFLTKRIPNWWTFSAIVLGIAAQAWLGGWSGAGNGALGALVGFGLFFPLYAFGAMGAGDVKLLMAIGAFTGPVFCVYAAAAGILAGGLYALVDVARHRRLGAMLGNLVAIARSVSSRGMPRPELDIDRRRSFSFGVALAAGVVVVIALQHRGVIP